LVEAPLSDTTPGAAVAEAEPEAPGDDLRESIVGDLRRHVGDALVEHYLKPHDDLWIRVQREAWAATGRALREMGFTYFCFLSALDWKPSPYGRGEDDPTQPPPERSTEVKQGYAGGETRFQVLARVTDTTRHVGVTIKADIPDGDLLIDSWHAIYAGANWHERETHEMFGIDFSGHPDLRNIYLPGEFEGYPLRKDFPLLSRIVKPWPGIVDVEPMPEERGDEGGDGSGAAAATSAEEALEGEVTDSAGGSAGSVSGAIPESSPSSDANEQPPPEEPS
jgi:NADH-quinone oxidoreductase subunit C